jgi:hypothetical protein
MHIPERFFQTVAVHIVKNIIDIEGWQVPLILGIHGPSGEGKTFMCENVLQQLGVKSLLISGGQLESENAGAPAALLRKTYVDAGRMIREGSALMASVLVNDFDTGVGNWGKIVQFTINTQQLFAEFMHLADYPEIVAGEKTFRIPIIITGNNFESLHAPLTRAGRMWSFEWIPNPQDRVNIVKEIFPLLSQQQIQDLVLTHFRDKPIAFFSHLKSSLLDLQIWQLIQEHEPQDVIRYVRAHQNVRIETLHILNDFKAIITAGEKLDSEGILADHLAPYRKE